MKSLFILVLACVCLSCSSVSGVDTPISPVPVTGIYYTTESSPDPLATFGVPYYSGPTGFHDPYLFLPYPNPASSSTIIEFRVPAQTRVRVWAATASTADVQEDASSTGAIIFRAPDHVVRTLLDESIVAGSYRLEFDLNDTNGRPLASGFYRIYAKFNDLLVWRDLAVCRNHDDYPCSFMGFFK